MEMKSRQNPKFSIIVPSHNGASHDFFTTCLRSIVNQIFEDYQLIVVADKCNDDTAKVAREYGAEVYEVDFGNDGFARNIGLDHARGEWILFLDDDDWWIHEFVLQTLASVPIADTVDIVQFAFYWQSYRGYTLMIDGGLPCNVWSKMWRRSYIGDIRVTERVYPAADKALIDAVFGRKPPQVMLMDSMFYYYNFMRVGSITQTTAQSRREEE